jgi:hypothetical protein
VLPRVKYYLSLALGQKVIGAEGPFCWTLRLVAEQEFQGPVLSEKTGQTPIHLILSTIRLSSGPLVLPVLLFPFRLAPYGHRFRSHKDSVGVFMLLYDLLVMHVQLGVRVLVLAAHLLAFKLLVHLYLPRIHSLDAV